MIDEIMNLLEFYRVLIRKTPLMKNSRQVYRFKNFFSLAGTYFE